MRIILFTGKGGVGKTTLSAATALLCAQKGYKTLVISTDAAHSLSDSFETQLSNQPKKITANLFGQEINALEQIEKNWGDIKSYLTNLFSSQGIDEIEAEEMSVFPGMEELFSLMEIRNYNKSSEYEVVIVDCAPTGDTLRLLSAPEITNWYLKHIFPIQRTAAKAVRPVASRILPFPFPEDKVFGAMKKLTTQLAEMKDILSDSKITTVRLVINPEKMVIKEAQRAFTFFNLFGYAVDLIIVNRVIPSIIKDAYFDKWKTIQSNYQQMIKECFSPIPIFSLELMDQEIMGKTLLSKIAKKIYGAKDPTSLFLSQKPITIQKADGGFDMLLNLPFQKRSDIDLIKNGDELIIKVGHFKRNIILPPTLINYSVESAKFETERLRICFRQ
ncbi:MAG: ArsA family ATPase [Candidatus Aminicenantes bacterium]|nr:ArsA family ATPase [Candidatus Aminicenantes bacterium]MDH5385134.1 ArsA family ATPase [Candidatus Aminicenantes bacterium]MDH5741922.1 ArsA family ATPase [Candidatus Aminicenantes bacterium]